MEFECEATDNDVIAFHDKFKEELPKYVKVSQGFHGETEKDIISTGQIIRIQAVSRQKRVLATFKSSVFQGRVFSFPLSFPEKFSIVKHGRASRKFKFLSEVLNRFDLPITVRYPKDQTITDGRISISSSIVPDIELLELFEECNLLGNCINDGDIFKDVVSLPLYNSRVKLSVVTGIKGQSADKWRRYCKEHANTCSFMGWGQDYGRQEIAEYDAATLQNTSSCTYAAPLRYMTIVSIMQLFEKDDKPNHPKPLLGKAVIGHAKKKPGDEPKKPTGAKFSFGKSVRQNYYATLDPRSSDDTYEEIKPHLPSNDLACTKVSKTDTLSVNQKPNADLRAKLPTVPPKPKTPKDQELKVKPPALPQRLPTQQSHITHGHVTHHYTNVVPRTHIQPTVQLYNEIQLSDVQGRDAPVHEVSDEADVVNNARSCLPNVANKDDVFKLTVDEVGCYLTKIGLDKFVDVFRDQMIDGPILVELDKEMLMEDFGMKGIEALRLIKFAQDGHVPVKNN